MNEDIQVLFRLDGSQVRSFESGGEGFDEAIRSFLSTEGGISGIEDIEVLAGPTDLREEPEGAAWILAATAGSFAAANELLAGLDKWGVRDAEVLVDLPPATPSYFREVPVESLDRPQPYLGSTRGINLAPIRDEAGGRGEQVRVWVIESGWNAHHPDLPPGISQFATNRPRLPVDPGQRRHGNAVLGILCAKNNGVGIDGIVPEATVEMALFRPSTASRGLSKSSFPGLLREVIERAGAGDVVVAPTDAIKYKCTCHRGDSCRCWAHSNRVGLEAWSAMRCLFLKACRKRVHVVCAAGNGLASHLDDFCTDWNFPSSALVVGASSSRRESRMPDSNWGSCVDLHAWGENVATCTETGYTDTFNGTSSATAIVGGVVAVLSSHVRAHTGKIITPRQMHQLLRETGTRPIDGIGVQPNVAKALARLKEVEYDLERL